jgi:hypothetical protein
MSWVPVFKVGETTPLLKHGRQEITSSSTIVTFGTEFPDTSYTVSITPYSNAIQTNTPHAYVLFDTTFTRGGFTVETSNATGFFWTAIYGSSS